MQPPVIPENEPQRLGVLKSLGILDTDADESFDRVTRLAARLFNVPTALVSLVDEERQWFKSRTGLAATETPRSISFCGHAILDDQPLIIEDTHNDKRFIDNPLVNQAPHIRFYAGYPLQLGDDIRLGTLCLIDYVPRDFPAEDVAMLKDLAAFVVTELRALQMASTDELTGLNNRRGFVAQATFSLSVCHRNGLPASLLFIDLDDFKRINDNHGHEAGDRALEAFANLLRQSFRESDVIGRIGGDEFAVLLFNTSESHTQPVIDKFEQQLGACKDGSGYLNALACSYGVTHCDPASPRSLEALLAESDRRMYARKHGKAN